MPTFYTDSASFYNLEVSSSVIVSGSFTLSGSLDISGSINTIAGLTGSLQGTASWADNAVTASYITLAQTASYVVTAQTASYVVTAQTASYYGGSVTSASYATTASYTETASYAPAYLPLTGGTINGNVVVNGTASVTFLNVTYESSSIIYSSGSNQFGDATNDTQTLIGRTIVSGSLEVTGSVNIPNITGSLLGTSSYSNQSLSSSYALTASYVETAQTASFVTSSNVYGPHGTNSILSASFAVSASWAPGSGGGGATFNGGTNVDNRLITATGTTPELNGEANLTFNGSTLTVTGDVTANSFTGSLQGTATTASFVTTAQTASYILGSNVSGNITGNAANIIAYTINQNLGTANQVTFAGVTSSLNVSGEVASRILSTDASKNIKALDTTTYPDLTELSYVKGVTSAIQTQLNGKEPTITNGFGITGTTTKAVSLTTAEAFCTAETTITGTAYADITGASITLAAGTWLILATINGSSQTTTVAVMYAAITDGANTVIAEGAQHIVAGTATVRTWGNVSLSSIVTPGVSTTYKLRGARGQTTQTGNVIISDGTGQGTANNVSNNSDKSTSIRAIRIA